jgi:hypothetical protein
MGESMGNQTAMTGSTDNKSSRMRMQALGMFVVGVTMWAAVPLLWLYIGSMIKSETDSLGLALVVMGIGAIVMIVLLVKVLGKLHDKWFDEFVELNDRKPQRTPLEPVLVGSVEVDRAVVRTIDRLGRLNVVRRQMLVPRLELAE